MVAPTRTKDKDGAASGTLGTFGVSLFSLRPATHVLTLARSAPNVMCAGEVRARSDAEG